MLTRPSRTVVVVGSLVLLFLILPNVVVVAMSFSSAPYLQFPPPGFSVRWYRTIVDDPRWIESFFRSVRVALATTCLSLALGTGAAFGLARGQLFGSGAIRGLLIAPLIIPHVIIGAAVYGLYVRLGLVSTEAGLAMAHTVLAVPVVMIAVTSAMRAVKRDLELAAMSLGASPPRTFFAVTLPLVKPGLLTGGLLAFITSFDELIIAIFVGGVRATTLPLKMWDGVRTEINPVLTAVSTVLVSLSIVALVVVEIVRRGSGRGSSGQKE